MDLWSSRGVLWCPADLWSSRCVLQSSCGVLRFSGGPSVTIGRGYSYRNDDDDDNFYDDGDMLFVQAAEMNLILIVTLPLPRVMQKFGVFYCSVS